MKSLYLFLILFILNLNVNAITNVKHILGCENEKLKLSCTNGKIIDILDGNYGRTTSLICSKGPIKNVTCYQENTVSILTDLCEGRNECSVEVENKVFGDSCEGTTKYLFILYECVSVTEFKYSVACEQKLTNLECNPGTVIHVYDANYGRLSQITCAEGPIKTTHCHTEHAANVVSKLCNQKRTCTVLASNSVFGDPCFGTHKYLNVKYKCVPGSDECITKSSIKKDSQCLDGSIILPSLLCDGKQDCPHGDDEQLCSYESTFACEHKKLIIKCKKDEIIKIINSNYGRTSAKICPQNDIRGEMNCRSKNSKQVVQSKCDGKQICEINASNNIFGDPCYGIVKYLDVQYECQPVNGHKINPRSLNNLYL